MMLNNPFLDVHGLTLDQAKIVINNNIKIAYENNIAILYINHGFNNGNKIKSWIKNNIMNNPYVIKVDSGDNEGISKIYIRLNLKFNMKK